MEEGYIYCFSNECMPGILKIGMTGREVEERLEEANRRDTWRPPTKYKIEIAKKVKNPREKEKKLHKLLEQYTERITKAGEFFRVSVEEIKAFFDIIDGEIWKEKEENIEEEEEEEEDEWEEEWEEEDDDDIVDYRDVESKKSKEKGCRDMRKCFEDGQMIRHKIGINKIIIGRYMKSENKIEYKGEKYSLNRFVMRHYEEERSRRRTANAWVECECEVNGKWISIYSLEEKK